jgi:hypothetical protein
MAVSTRVSCGVGNVLPSAAAASAVSATITGRTVYLNETKQYHASALVSFDFQSKKEDSETKVGNEMNIEGGVGADFLEGGLSVGLAYYWSSKLTQDHIEGFPDILIRGKNRVFALGPEVTLALAKGNTGYGFLKVNYEWEVYARTTTQGSEFSDRSDISRAAAQDSDALNV